MKLNPKTKDTLGKASVFVGIAVILLIYYFWPKSCKLGGEMNVGQFFYYTGYYRGFGLVKEPGILGRNYFCVRFAPTVEADGFTDVQYTGEGWNPFRGTYPNGTLREEGVCQVHLNFVTEPLPEYLEAKKEGKYYDPNGKLGSEIRDGSGIQTYWNHKGVKVLELEFKDFKMTHLARWHENGQPMIERHYVDGLENGPVVSYYESGVKEKEGQKRFGQPVGNWTYYNADGSVKEVIDYEQF
jgi:hypothetical protein